MTAMERKLREALADLCGLRKTISDDVEAFDIGRHPETGEWRVWHEDYPDDGSNPLVAIARQDGRREASEEAARRVESASGTCGVVGCGGFLRDIANEIRAPSSRAPEDAEAIRERIIAHLDAAKLTRARLIVEGLWPRAARERTEGEATGAARDDGATKGDDRD